MQTPEDETADPQGDEDAPEPPLTAWQSISDVVRGLLALLLFSIGVLALYVAGGFFAGLLAWAAPALLAIGGAVAFARYLSRVK